MAEAPGAERVFFSDTDPEEDWGASGVKVWWRNPLWWLLHRKVIRSARAKADKEFGFSIARDNLWRRISPWWPVPKDED